MCVETFQPGNQKLPLRLKGTSSGDSVIELGLGLQFCPPIGLSSTLLSQVGAWGWLGLAIHTKTHWKTLLQGKPQRRTKRLPTSLSQQEFLQVHSGDPVHPSQPQDNSLSVLHGLSGPSEPLTLRNNTGSAQLHAASGFQTRNFSWTQHRSLFALRKKIYTLHPCKKRHVLSIPRYMRDVLRLSRLARADAASQSREVPGPGCCKSLLTAPRSSPTPGTCLLPSPPQEAGSGVKTPLKTSCSGVSSRPSI